MPIDAMDSWVHGLNSFPSILLLSSVLQLERQHPDGHDRPLHGLAHGPGGILLGVHVHDGRSHWEETEGPPRIKVRYRCRQVNCSHR